MNNLRKAAEIALEALIGAEIHDPEAVQEAIQALRQALTQPEWVGLTEEEVDGCWFGATYMDETCFNHFAYLIEEKLKEKNT